jgi:SAM-dependent methyltransferase
MLTRMKRSGGGRYRAAEEAVGRALFSRGDYEDTSGSAELPPRAEYALSRRYEPSEWFLWRRAVRRRDVRPGDVFVDFGSGKGRVVCLAARLPFRRVIGVEFVDEFNRVARRNIDANRHRFACQDVQVVTSDATAWEIPDDMTWAYFFNPFTAPILRTVLDKIVESLDRAPRRLTLVYVNPLDSGRTHPTPADEIEARGRFRLVRKTAGRRRSVAYRWVSVYVHEPESVQESARETSTRARHADPSHR